MQPDKVFVYGTLRRGYALHEHLDEGTSRFLGRGRIRGELYDLGEYPGAIPGEAPGQEITGELYQLDDPERQLPDLDELEEFDPAKPEQSLFIRRLTDVELDNGTRVRAWVYFLPRRPAKARLIAGGDYARAC
jgi:gamma-glutamylcyclotransferase (GGCT)/AIG2-like uncharacterized protein YtfP